MSASSAFSQLMECSVGKVWPRMWCAELNENSRSEVLRSDGHTNPRELDGSSCQSTDV